MPEEMADGGRKLVTLDDLIDALDKRERAPSNVPKVDTFHFKGERMSDWLDLTEQALVGLSDEVKLQRVLRYVLHSHHQEVGKVVDAANGSWARFRDMMQRKYRKEVVKVPEEEEKDDDEEDERLRQEEDQRAELRAKKRGAQEEAEPSVPDSVPKRKKYAVRMEEGFDVERMVDKLLEGHNDLMNLKDILASAPSLHGELKGRLSRRLVPNVHLSTVLPREVEWTEAGTRMDWKCVACGQVDLVIRNLKCTGMVDKGAEMNIIRENEAVMIGMEIDRSNHGVLHGANCKAAFCGTTSNVIIEIGKDLQQLNAVTVQDAGGLPNADALSESCAGRPIISLIDLYSGYDQFPIYPPDRPVTAMHTPRGLIHMNVAPQGWMNAVAMVQRYMIRAMQTVSPHITQPYIDDLAVKGPKEKEEDEVMPGVRRFVWKHVQDIDQVLELLGEHNLTASGPKSKHCMREATILGFVCNESGRRPDVKKTDKILEWPVPFRSIADVRSFLGTCGFWRSFVKDFATKTEHLRKLVRQDQEWVWGEDQEEAVGRIKGEFKEGGLVLGAPNYEATEERPFVIETDAGPTALGGVLIQADTEGKERPLRFESRTLNTTKRNYSQFKKETLAVLHCLRTFQNYVFGRRLILRVDPTALACSLKNYTLSDPTVARWLTYIWMFNFELERIPGNKNRADGLSRINWDGSDEESIEDTPPVDGFFDQEEDVHLHINEWSLRLPSCVSHPIWLAPKGYEQKEELVLKPFHEEDPWGSKDVGWMMKLALADDEFKEGEIKEAFQAEEYDGIYRELGLLLSCEMRDRDASAKAQKMRHLYVMLRASPMGPDGLPIRLEEGNAEEFIPAYEQYMRDQGTGQEEWMQMLPLWTRRAERSLARQAAGPAQAAELPATYGLEQVEFRRIMGSDLRGPSPTLPEGGEAVPLRTQLDRLEAHLDASQWGASQLGADQSRPARYEPVEDEPEEEPPESGPETGSREPEEPQTEGFITIGDDTPPPTPMPEQARQYWLEGIHEPDSEEMLGPPPEATTPPPTQAEPDGGERARTPTTVAPQLTESTCACMDVEVPTSGEPPPGTPPVEEGTSARDPLREGHEARTGRLPGETKEEKRARVQVRLEELYHEKLRMEVAGEAPKPPIDPPTSEQRISEAWASYESERDAARLRSRELSTQLAEERAENQAWRSRMEVKEAEWEKRLRDMAAMVERLSATKVVDWMEQSRYGIQGEEVQGLFGWERTTEPPQQGGMGKIFLDPIEAAARREAEEERFSFRTPTELASQQATPMTIEIPEGEPAQGPQPPLEEGGPTEESPTILLEVQEGALTGAAASTEPEAMGGEASRLDELVVAMELDMPSGEPQR
ncbi:hypothetical protein CBR_g16073 [Chara braunii]|uniref:Reverse transcriptase RNase H-like domain-containing protein n=1 Tax=Chara braunii TaxID=69332 RepID=A0A388JTC4_CHABU|nr:hypothetical protein CBR_g16073 [Chara braunii]|eukprot:GBG60952.1 hypothetical protein CBR_g16073 [Chara braunii]